MVPTGTIDADKRRRQWDGREGQAISVGIAGEDPVGA
jgi:hypothetical protein